VIGGLTGSGEPMHVDASNLYTTHAECVGSKFEGRGFENRSQCSSGRAITPLRGTLISVVAWFVA
jgi:hypothetical protein